jgi:hypothetical protein
MVAVTARLTGDHVVRGPALAANVARMSGDTQMGPALHDGEVVLAAIDHEFIARGRAQGSHASLFLTDRRIFGSLAASNITNALIDLPLSHVTDVRDEGGMLTSSATAVMAGGGAVKFPMYGKQIVQHLRNVLTVPPEHRNMGPLAIAPGPGDPVGAHAASSALVSGSPITRALPALAFEAGRRGKLTEAAARNLLERAVILDRSFVMGRGMHQGHWLSTLPRPALAALFAAMLGQPAQSSGDVAWERHDFSVTPGGRSTGAAVAASAVGLASAAILGVGFIARSGGGLGFNMLRATFVDFPCGSGVQLAAVQGPNAFRLPFAATGLLQGMFATITRVEQRRILAETVLSGEVPPEKMSSVACQSLEAAVAGMGAQLQLAALYPKSLASRYFACFAFQPA